jgi:hypothetical protein
MADDCPVNDPSQADCDAMASYHFHSDIQGLPKLIFIWYMHKGF